MWILLIIVVVALGLILWRMAKWSKDTDEDLKYMNEGRANGPGIFGIFNKHRD
jgi:hypothetical protein